MVIGQTVSPSATSVLRYFSFSMVTFSNFKAQALKLEKSPVGKYRNRLVAERIYIYGWLLTLNPGVAGENHLPVASH